jgi:hypothetical protein
LKGGPVKNLKQSNFSDLILTPENLCIASTLIVPLVLLIFLPVESLFVLTMLTLCFVTITVFDIKKDRDYCRRSWESCINLLEEEKKKNKKTINCDKSIETSEVSASM